MHAPVMSETTTTDADSAQALLAAAYSEGRVRFESEGDFLLAHRRQDFGALRIDDVRYSFHTEFEMSPLGTVLIMRVADGELAVEKTAGRAQHFAAGDVFLCAQPDAGFRATTRTRRAQAVSLDLRLFDQVGDEPVHEVIRRFADGALPTQGAVLWRRTIDYVTTTLASDDAVAQSPLVLGAAGRMLAAATVSAFSADPERETSAERPGTTAVTVRQAVAFLEANPELDIGVADIAQACHVSIRALQLAFRRHLDTTPMGYLRRVRLDRVRSDLREATAASGVTVTQLAARWGFADPGSFSAHYRRAYGESPRVTLRA